MKNNLLDLHSKLANLSLGACLFCFTFLFNNTVYTQTYAGSVTFDANDVVISGTYSFDYVIACSVDGTSAAVTVTYVDPPGPPAGLVPQIHLGGGTFVGMSGSNPYTYSIAGLTDCDFNIQFWMAYAGGLYSSPVFLTPANAALPISLTSFSATRQGTKAIRLDWKTSTEISSDYFGVERSADGLSWEQIHRVSSAVNSNTDISYSYVDAEVQSNPTIYYRLKLTDLDGTYEYSDVLSVPFAGGSNRLVPVYPVPAKDFIKLDLTGIDMEEGEVQMVMYDFSGRVLSEKNVSSSVIETIDIQLLPTATYLVVIRQGTETIYQTRVVKMD